MQIATALGPHWSSINASPSKRRRFWLLVFLLVAGLALAATYVFNNCACNVTDPEDVNMAINSIFNASPGAPTAYQRGDVIVVSATPTSEKATYTWVFLTKAGWVPNEREYD
jgi:hypothetical protein